MKRKFTTLKIMLVAAAIALQPISAYAYTTPYYAQKLNNSISIGFQGVQIVAKKGVVYISSYSDCSIQKIVNNAFSESVAGQQGYCGYTPDGTKASKGLLQGVTSIDVADDGTVYFTEPNQHHVRAILPDGTLKTIAGNGKSVDATLLSDSEDAKKTPFNDPAYIKVGPDKNVYVYDSGVIRRIYQNGHTDHVVGSFGSAQNYNPYVEGGIAKDHHFSSVSFSQIQAGASWSLFDFDPQGNMYAASGGKIFKIEKETGVISTQYTPAPYPSTSLEDKPLDSERFGTFNGFEIDDQGKFWVTGAQIHSFTLSERISRTVAGGGAITTPPSHGSPISANDLKLAGARSLSVDDDKIYYISSYPSPNGATTYYAGVLSKTRDSTPPIIKPLLSQEPDSNGWNNSPTTLTWRGEDQESPTITKSGCDSVTVSATSGKTITCKATSEGGSSEQSITIKVDSTKPIVKPLVSPAPNSDGWNNTDVSLSWDVSDNDSPITYKSGCDATTQAEDTEQNYYTCVAISGGGSALGTAIIKRDTVPPTISSTSLNNGIFSLPFGFGYLSLLSNSTILNTTISDSLSGAKSAEYFIDKDPGVGKAKALAIATNKATAQVNLYNINGLHTIYIRAQDTAGNWSLSKGVQLIRIGL